MQECERNWKASFKDTSQIHDPHANFCDGPSHLDKTCFRIHTKTNCSNTRCRGCQLPISAGLLENSQVTLQYLWYAGCSVFQLSLKEVSYHFVSQQNCHWCKTSAGGFKTQDCRTPKLCAKLSANEKVQNNKITLTVIAQ